MNVTIPCEASKSWRRVFVSFLSLDESNFDIAAFKALFGAHPGNGWLVADGEASPCVSRVTLAVVDGGGDSAGVGSAGESARRFRVSVNTLRSGAARPGETAAATHEQLLEALKSAVTTDDLACAVGLDAEYPGSRWRLPLLTRPPLLDQEQLGLGRVTLSGIKLAFEQSPVGLVDAELDTRGEGHNTMSLFFTMPISRADLPNLYEAALTKGEALASLFVETGSVQGPTP